MVRPTIMLSEAQHQFLSELAIEYDGVFSVDVFRTFYEHFDFKISKKTLQRKFLQIWSEIGVSASLNSSNFEF